MSADTKDFSLIKDEDVLRKMWQETEDFGKKKEIRTHMYKLREAKLREFYNSGEEFHQHTETKSFSKPTHADLIADHSFMSLKSKEIRDSESPTRDCSMQVIDKSGGQNWNVVTSTETSQDGKTHSTKRLATTSGTQEIQGGKIDYAAKNEQQAVVFKDGDDKNFIKSVGAASNTVIKQEAEGGDENSKYKASSFKSTSSSRVVTEHKSTSGDVVDFAKSIPSEHTQITTYTSGNIPSDVKNHPNYIEGKTKVIRETKTLPDGSVVTTTRYETKGGSSQTTTKKSSQVTSSSASTTEQRSSKMVSSHSSSSSKIIDEAHSKNNAIEYMKNDSNFQDSKRIQDTRDVKENLSRNQEINFETSSTTSERKSKTSHQDHQIRSSQNQERVIKKHDYIEPTEIILIKNVEPMENVCTTSTSTRSTSTKIVQDKKAVNDAFINIERQQEIETRKSPEKSIAKPIEHPKKEEPHSYEMPEKRQPIKPGKSELDMKIEPTEGQYDTTYRAHYTPKRISVELSPTHDAFARSLRSVSPDRFSKTSSPSRRNSNNSLRSSTSPEKMRHPSRYSPERNRSTSPKKTFSTETITISRTSPEKYQSSNRNVKSTTCNNYYSTDTVSKRRNITETREIDSSTLTRKKTRSPSPTSTTRGIRYTRNEQVTDLDDVVRPTSLEITTTKRTKKVTDRSSTSPLESPKKSPTKEFPPKKDLPHDRPLKRTDTYEERCKQILGITSDVTEKRKSSLERASSFKRNSFSNDLIKRHSSPTKEPTPKSPTKSPVNEFPSQIRRSPEKQAKDKKSTISEFPSQIRKSPEKAPLQSYPERKSPTKCAPTISEFPSQIRKSQEKEPLPSYPEKRKPSSSGPTINEFPSQIRKSPEREPLPPYPERKSPTKYTSTINEFPSQIRKSPEKEPLEPYPERKSPPKSAPTISEFPSQIRKSPVREPLEPYPEKKRPSLSGPSISEFPSQIRKSPEREPLEPYPEKKRPSVSGPTISEFPSQIRRSPVREPLEPYPEKKRPSLSGPTISEFPSQIRKTPEREPLAPYPEKQKPETVAPKICEFPSQIRRSPEREPLPKYPQKQSPTKEAPTISEFPSQVRKSPEKLTPSGKKPKSKKPKTTSDESSSSEEEIEDQFISNNVSTTTEERVPVVEPPFIKKHVSLLYSDDEEENIDKKKTTQELLEEEIMANAINENKSKTVKKDEAKKTIKKDKNEKFIKKEKSTTTKSVCSKPEKKVTDITKTTRTVTTEKVKPKTSKTSEKITLWNVDNLDNLKEDKSVHIRTHRIDTTVKKSNLKDDKKPKTFVKTSSFTQKKDVEDLNTINKRLNEKNVTSSVTKKFTDVKTSPIAKKPIVNTSITITSKPVTKVVTTKTTTINNRLTKTPQLTPKPKDQKPKLNGHVSVDSSECTINIDLNKRATDKKITRTTSEQIIKKPDSSKPRKLEKKCISTKSIMINNKETVSEPREVIIDLIRSTSSREPTPDRVCPLPVTGDVDSGKPRYPDKVDYPDDGYGTYTRRKSKKLSDIPIIEGEDTTHFTRITDITESVNKITEVDKVEETDDSLLSVDKKISKFLDTADQLTKKPIKQTGPAPKIGRPKFVVTEDLEEDECLLSVSDKVSKFINTAEELIAPQSIERPKSPKCMNYPEVSKKVSDYISTTTEKTTTTARGPAPKRERPNLEDVDEELKKDECILSVSDKVNKFVSTAEKLKTDVKKSSKMDKTDLECVQIETEDQMYTRKPSLDKTPTTKNYSTEIRTTTTEKYTTRGSSPKLQDSTPKSSRRPSQPEDQKVILSPAGRLRSTETIKKAKAIFENREQEVLKQRDILSRPSVFEGRNKEKVSKKLTYSDDEECIKETKTYKLKKDDELKSTKLVIDKMFKPESRPKSPEKYNGDVPHYMTPLDRNREKSPTRAKSIEKESIPSEHERSASPEGNLPHYMKPLDRSLRPFSPHRESVNQLKSEKVNTEKTEKCDYTQTKFGVNLKQTDSKISTTATRRSSNTIEKITEEEILEIFDLEILEDLLERVTSYEIRRIIRTQIRLVKKLITEGTLESYIKKRKQENHKTEYQTSYIRKSSSPDRKVNNKLYQHTDLLSQRDDTKKKTEYQSSYVSSSTKSERKSSSDFTSATITSQRKSTSPEKILRASSPEKSKVTSTTTTKSFTTLKKTPQVTTKVVTETKPEWMNRSLRKVETTTTTVKSPRKITTTTTTRRVSPTKEIVKGTDLITSSYGVGPTDENGSPLFGLKALRAQNKGETKVEGTVVRSHYYSKNGEEPVGEITVTKYSNDPKSLGSDQVTSVTTTQKFGYRDTPSLKSLSDKKHAIREKDDMESTVTTTKSSSCSSSSKVTRRGSVKALSQKFIDNAVETLKNEKQSTYPKAGLILRSTSFKDSSSGTDDASRESSPINETKETFIQTSTSSSYQTSNDSFLTNKNKISGVKDVISRMKASDVEEGDTEEDIKARSLLNKFIGSQVILSGMEGMKKTKSSSQTITSSSSTSSPSVQSKRTTKIITTITEGGKPVTKTRIFQRPVTEADLETVWDEQTLKLLLEQSTDYEERRLIRARLRQVMAEQEACTQLVEKATQETKSSGKIEEKVMSSKTVTEGPTTTTQVTTRVTTQQQITKKPVSPFAKFRQLDKQNSLNSPRTSN